MPIKPTRTELVQEIVLNLLKETKIKRVTQEAIFLTCWGVRARMDLQGLPRRPKLRDVLRQMGLVP